MVTCNHYENKQKRPRHKGLRPVWRENDMITGMSHFHMQAYAQVQVSVAHFDLLVSK